MKHRITLQELAVGQPLAWDVYGKDGVLLLRRGQSVQTQKGLERLVEDGLFLQGEDSASRPDPAIPEEKPSAMQHLVDARRILSNVFDQKPENVQDFAGRMDKLVNTVRTACDTHAGVCLSSILLVQDKTYCVKHALDVAILSSLLAKELKLDEAEHKATVAAALTMNIGMYEVQDQINGINGPLNDKLKSMIRMHPTLGADRLAKLGIQDEKWLAYVRQHHEQSDGSGYPAGLAGDAIEMGARIISVVDKYCAMISARNYRGAQKPNAALRDLYVKHGPQIDVVVASTMIRYIGIYPIGVLVRLKSAEIAVVTGPGEGPDTPAVHAVIGRSGLALETAAYRKTHLSEFAIEDVLTLDKLSIPIRMTVVWGKDAKLN